MSIVQRLKDKNLWFNVGLLVLAAIVLLFLLNFILAWYTHHGESLIVPSFKGMTVEEVQKVCDERDLRYLIRDSIYDPTKPRFSVVDQNPKPESKVKRGRRIYLTINQGRAPMVQLPDMSKVKDKPLKQVQSMLESQGFVVGTPITRPNIAEGAVLELQSNGKVLEYGSSLPKGSTIIPVIGIRNNTVPALLNLGNDALIFIAGQYKFIPIKQYDANVKDSAKAIIYKQDPLPGKTISPGSPVKVWLKNP